MYTEEQALRILRRNTLTLLAVIVALAVVAIGWIMRNGTGMKAAFLKDRSLKGRLRRISDGHA